MKQHFSLINYLSLLDFKICFFWTNNGTKHDGLQSSKKKKRNRNPPLWFRFSAAFSKKYYLSSLKGFAMTSCAILWLAIMVYFLALVHGVLLGFFVLTVADRRNPPLKVSLERFECLMWLSSTSTQEFSDFRQIFFTSLFFVSFAGNGCKVCHIVMQ